MKVDVIEPRGNGQWLLRSAAGSFTASWAGQEPRPGQAYEIELDVDGLALWGTDVSVGDEPREELVDDDAGVRLAGQIEEFGEDDLLVLRVAGTPIMIETDGDAPLGVVGRWATVRVPSVVAYPYDI